MVIIQVAGGLGNQLQQYALYQKFISLGKEARLDISWFTDSRKQEKVLASRALELDELEGVEYRACTGKEKTALLGSDSLPGKLRRKLFPFTVHHFQEKQLYHPELLSLDHCYISGYFACEKYYVDLLPELRKKIRFPKSTNPQNAEMEKKIKGCEAVSVHLRRGDYLDPENAAIFGNICTEAYYRKAMELVKEKRPDCHFFLFSDDPAYAAEKYTGSEYTVVDINHGRDSYYDIYLMSLCRHNICANSTFSFWGARLNDHEDKIMIRPTIHKNSQVFEKEEMERLWESWRFISPQGKEM